MQEFFEWTSIGFGAISAVLWAWASFKRIPRLTVGFGGVLLDDNPWLVAQERLSRVTRWASALTAFAVTSQTVAAVLEKLSI
ncbi:hypothetical protein [Sulfitobacter sp. MOLA879]|uniref:hypothetical protein n=1 Tax=Sulfitobacter sp. MOLA879 TaxID=3368579 RepID=UPI00374A491E